MHVVRCGGRGWDCNQFLVKDPKANRFDMVDAGHGLDFDNVLREISAVIDPARIRNVVVTHEHLDHVNGLPRWQALGATLHASRAAAAKLHDGRDPTSERFGARIPAIEVVPLDDGDRIQLGDASCDVLATPGHSPGSACYWDAPSGTLFSGDTLFAEGGIGRFDFPDGHLATEAQSILRLSRLPVRMLHCGHGDSVEGGAATRSVNGSLRHVQACIGEAQ